MSINEALETGHPPYVSQQLRPYAPTRALHTSAYKLLQVPHTNLCFGSRCFHVSAPTLWNSLPHGVRFCESLTTFWKHLKTFFLQSVFSGVPSASDSVFWFLVLYKLIYLLTYLLTYLLIHLKQPLTRLLDGHISGYWLIDLRNPTLSIDVFKRYLKTFLFAQC